MSLIIKITILVLPFIMVCQGYSKFTPHQRNDQQMLKQRWERVEVTGAFSFLVPAGLEKQNVRGIDSEIGEYRSNQLRVSFDFGLFSDNLVAYSGMPEYKEMTTEIDGKKAKIVFFTRDNPGSEYKYFAAAHFPAVKNSDGTENKLTITVESTERTSQNLAMAIFESTIFWRE